MGHKYEDYYWDGEKSIPVLLDSDDPYGSLFNDYGIGNDPNIRIQQMNNPGGVLAPAVIGGIAAASTLFPMNGPLSNKGPVVYDESSDEARLLQKEHRQRIDTGDGTLYPGEAAERYYNSQRFSHPMTVWRYR